MRWALHLGLLLLTFASLAVAGAPDLRSVRDLAELGSQMIAGLPYALWVLSILGAHELGHYAACRHYRIPATLPFFIPGFPPLGSFGAVIRIRGPIPHRRALFDVAAAGPLAGFAVALPALVLGLRGAEPFEGAPEGWLLGQPVVVTLLRPLLLPHTAHAEQLQVGSVFMAGWVGVLVTSLNLFPVGQLDGGHAAYALSRGLHRLLTRVTLLGLLAVTLMQLLEGEVPSYLLWFAILLWMRDRHPRLLDEDEPLGAARRWVALLLLVLFVLCFIPVPFRFV